jgi:hypothetical protein
MIDLQIKEHRDSKLPLHVSGAFDVQIPWQEFIDNINSSYKEESDQPEKSDIKFGRVGNVRFYDRMTMVIDYAGTFPYTGLNKIKDQISSYGLSIIATMSLISLTNSEETTSKHCDPYDVFYLQCIGSVQWSVWNNETRQDFVLNPGDFIFVPAYLDHEVTSLSPRTALSFMVK